MMNALLILIFHFKFINSCLLYLVKKKPRGLFIDLGLIEIRDSKCCLYVHTLDLYFWIRELWNRPISCAVTKLTHHLDGFNVFY